VKQIRLLLADHIALVRHGIRALMTGMRDVEIIGEAATADDAILLAGRLHPHVVLIDQDLPGDGLQAIGAIKDRAPGVEVVVLTDTIDPVKALQAVELGATGYLVKDIPSANLASAIRSLTRNPLGNGHPVYPESTRRLLEQMKPFAGGRSKLKLARQSLALPGLTSREMDIVLQLARGQTDREIAIALVVAEGTVKTHMRNILRKLDARNRTHAVAQVLRRGVIN
jgi:DNA-binding NarL/FixJ family response regulator